MDLFANENPVITSSAMVDGGAVMIVDLDGQKVLWRGTPEGEPQWAKAIPTSNLQPSICPEPGGGVYLLGRQPHQIVPMGPEFDSVYVTFTVNALQSDGTESWSREVKFGYLATWEGAGVPRIEGVIREDGSLLVTALSWSLGLRLFALDMNGNLLWSKSVYDASFQGNESILPLPDAMLAERITWTKTVDGGVLGLLASNSMAGLRMFKLNTDGSFAWAKRFRYSEAQLDSYEGSGAMLTSGDLMITFRGNYLQPPRIFALRVTNDGVLADKDIYLGMTSNFTSSHLIARPDDGWAVATPDYSPSIVLFEVGPSGEVTRSWNTPSVVHEDFTYTPALLSLSGNSESLVVGHLVKRTHNVFATIDYAVANTRITGDDPGCLFVNTPIDHFEVPDSLVIEDALPGLNAVAISPVVTNGQTMQSHAALATSGLCAALLSVPELDAGTFNVINTIGGVFQPIRITSTEAGLTFRFMSITGSVALATDRKASSGSIELRVDDLAAGTYILEAFDRIGSPRGRARVVVR